MTTPAEREELAEAIRCALVAAELHGGDYVSVEQSRTADEEMWSVFYRVFGVEGLPSPPALISGWTSGPDGMLR